MLRQAVEMSRRNPRMTPAMAAGVTDRLWDVADLVALWEQYEQRGGKSSVRKALTWVSVRSAIPN